MASKPAPLELSGGQGPRQRIWQLIRQHRTEFELAQVRPGDVPIATVRTYLQSLLRGGYIGYVGTRVTETGKQVFVYRLERDNGVEAPRLKRDGSPVTMGLAQEQMWRTLGMLGGDTNARELAAHASTAAIPVSPVAAADYLRNLHRAGYLSETKPGKGIGKGGIQARYTLKPAHNTGPRPPMVCRTQCVYDPNLGRVVHWDDVTEEDALYV